VRGLDYYNDLCFEFITKEEVEKKQAVLAGGRYDGLASAILPKSKSIFGTGFAVGIDRLLDHFEKEISQVMKSQESQEALRVGFVILEDPSSVAIALDIRRQISEWAQNSLELDTLTCSIKKTGTRLELLAQRGCRFAFIVGSEEAAEGKVLLRDLERKVQRRVAMDELRGKSAGEWLGPAGFECVP